VLASPVWAECFIFDSVTKGVTDTQADGSDQCDRGLCQICRGPYGVYPTESTCNGIGGTAEYGYAKAPPEPGIGMGWTGNIKVNDIPHYDTARQDWRRGKGRVMATDLREMTLSGDGGGCGDDGG
jgi:hypothetical protein